MSKHREIKTPEKEFTGELITGPREYVLKSPIILKGEVKSAGEKVKLEDHDAEWLKGSGHI